MKSIPAQSLTVVLSLLTIFAGNAAETGQGDPTAEQILLRGKDAEIVLLSQKWRGIAAGTTMTVGGEVGRIKRDLATLNVSLRITNASSTVYEIGDDFMLEGSSSPKSYSLQVARDPLNHDSVNGSLKIKGGQTQTIYLSGPFIGLDEWKAAGQLTVRHKILPILLKVTPLPERDKLLAGPEAGSPLASLKARIAIQRWVSMPRGTAATSQGTPVVIGKDMAGLEVEVEVQNPTGEPVSLPLEFFLVNTDRSIRVALAPTDDMKLSRREQREGVTVPSSGKTTIRLETAMKQYNQVTSWQPLFVSHSSCNWKMALPPVPSFDTLSKVGEKASK